MYQIRAIIGLGNPGASHAKQRHNIGFRIVDEIAHRYDANWRDDHLLTYASVIIHDKEIILIKPQTYMNNSGKVIPFVQKKGIKPSEILVVHDELEKPFGSITYRMGGSARGHNGLRSIIAACGIEFARLRIGIGRPENKEEVPAYVLQPFSESEQAVQDLISRAVEQIIILIDNSLS